MHRFRPRAHCSRLSLPITLTVLALAGHDLSPLLDAATPQRGQAGGAAPANAQPVSDSASRPRYVVQLGAFRNREHAELRAVELTAQGYDARIAPGGEWNRVIMGPFAARAAADAALNLLSLEGIEAIVRHAYAEDADAVPPKSDPALVLAPPPAPAVVASVARWEAPPAALRVRPARVALQPQGDQPLGIGWTEPLFGAMFPTDLIPAEDVKPPLEKPRAAPVGLAAANEAPLSPARPSSAIGVERRSAMRALGIVVLQASARTLSRAASENDVAVQVTNEAGAPVEGAVLTFSLPSDGASGAFANGDKSMTVLSDSGGRASTVGFVPNGLPGDVAMSVTASYQGLKASTTVVQRTPQPQAKASKRLTAAILGALGAGAAVGLVMSLGGESSSLPTAGAAVVGPVRGAATVGDPSVGAP